jgi:hypothetical protein
MTAEGHRTGTRTAFCTSRIAVRKTRKRVPRAIPGSAVPEVKGLPGEREQPAVPAEYRKLAQEVWPAGSREQAALVEVTVEQAALVEATVERAALVEALAKEKSTAIRMIGVACVAGVWNLLMTWSTSAIPLP